MKPSSSLVVGIGASAGGIPAFESFFRELPDDCAMVFIIVTHLSPERPSLLHEVIGRYTKLPVQVAEDQMELQPHNIYVMPEGKILTVKDGRLNLHDDNPAHRERKPIDVFFASLAVDQGEHAVGIVLSGGDGDGTLGVKAIKEHGGITFAQSADGSGPRNPEMPASAVASGLIDFAVPTELMPRHLLQLQNGADPVDLPGLEAPPRQEDSSGQRLQAEISGLLRRHAGHDFSGYKNKTFMRRVARRMKVLDLRTVEAYVERLREDKAEIMALFRDLLINVTNFFRDGEAFQSLKETVIPKLLEGRGASDKVRIWVPGCATGEEVYSLAILLLEQMEDLPVAPQVQIFATDIDEQALSVARAGRYPEALLAEMDPARRERYFSHDGASYVVVKEVRELCVFSPHSVISDPPFSRMDLVSCRNLLIYLGLELQSQVIPTFHYALRPGGYLFLGTSEGVSRHTDLFAPLNKQHRIFQSRGHGGAARRLPIALDKFAGRHRIGETGKRRAETNDMRLRQRAEAQVLERYAPAHVIVTSEGEILHFSSNTGHFMKIPRGAPSRQLFDLVRSELRVELRALLRQAMEAKKPASRQVLMLEDEGSDGSMVGLTAEPLDGSDDEEALFLILFTPLETWTQPASVEESGNIEERMELELRDLRERLQSTIEEYETALEELKSSNEELVSVNEEAQSTNEELEASKEEMQSLNEELSTINGELSSSVEELDRANTDLKNLYAATRIATIFLDDKLVIRNFTPAAASLFNLRQADVGRPFTDLAGALHYPNLQDRVKEVYRTGEVVESKLPAGSDGTAYLSRLMPYRSQTGEISGVIVTMVDISSLAQAEEQQKMLISELNHRVKNMLAMVISLTNSTRKTTAAPEKFAEKLLSRLHGMARAYSLLSQSEWTKVSIRELVQTEAEAFGAERIEAQGPDVRLTPSQSMALSMVVHEMATNAAKYGALSNGVGRVLTSWQVDEGRLTFHWREEGGPEVRALDPKGFGLTLIEGQLRSQPGGEINLSFPAEGVLLEASLPLEG